MASAHGSVDVNIFASGLPENATDDQKIAFSAHALKTYKDEGWTGRELAQIFKEDFGSFNLEDFYKMNSSIRRQLRGHLRRNGCFVKIEHGKHCALSLYESLSTNMQWPDNEPIETHFGNPSGSSEIQNRLPARSTNHHPVVLNDINETDNIARGQQIPSAITSNTLSTTTGNYAKTSMIKSYSSSAEKYKGHFDDNLDRKIELFELRSDQFGLPASERSMVIDIILADDALDYYLDKIRPLNLSYSEIIEMLRKRFNTKERIVKLKEEWDATKLTEYIKKYNNKTIKDVLELMIRRLSSLHRNIPNKTEEDLRDKLLSATRGVDECRLAQQKPADTVQGVIADLHMALSTYKKESDIIPSANFTDRKRRDIPLVRKCIVCGKIGCWSTNHGREKRRSAFRKNQKFRALIARLDDENTVSDDELDTFLHGIEDAINLVDSECSHCNHTEGFPKFSLTPTSNVTTVGLRDREINATLAENSIYHVLTSSTTRRYDSTNFEGIMIDTGCSFSSIASIEQYRAYCSYTGKKPQIRESSSRITFGKGSSCSSGIAKCTIPFGTFTIDFEVQILADADIPILLSLADMDRMMLKYDNIQDILEHIPSGEKVSVHRKYGHPFYKWCNMTISLFTEQELRRLHKRFGHPSSEKLFNLLKRADIESITPSTRKALEKISDSCDLCQRNGQKPRRFKFTLREEKDFNQSVYIDIMYVDNKPILHVVCEATRYQAARWLKKVSAEEVWKAFKFCWIDCYLGPPDLVVHDSGTNFMARAFQTNSALMFIRTKSIPVEAAQSMSFVERYHEPLRRAYRIIRQEISDIDDETALMSAVKSVNDSVGPDGLIPTLLVYGAIPRLGSDCDPPTPSMIQRATAVRKATQQITKYFSQRQIRDSLNKRNGPDLRLLNEVPLGGMILVYRENTRKWEGPFKLLNRSDETLTLMCKDGPKDFRSTSCKPYIRENIHMEKTETSTPASEEIEQHTTENSVEESETSRLPWISETLYTNPLSNISCLICENVSGITTTLITNLKPKNF